MIRISIFLLLVFLLAGCTAEVTNPDTPVTNPPMDSGTPSDPVLPSYLPQPGDSELIRGNVHINASELLIRESFPPQVSIGIKGDLPTPCHQLRVNINEPDSERKIPVDVYSVVEPDKVCIQVLKPFEEYIDLGTFPTGHYTVWINGDKIGEFDT